MAPRRRESPRHGECSVQRMPAGGSPVPADGRGRRRLGRRLTGLRGQTPDWARLRQAADQAAARSVRALLRPDRWCSRPLRGRRHHHWLQRRERVIWAHTLRRMRACFRPVCRRHGRLLAVSVTAGDGRPLTPCGRCRQLLMEHGGPELLLDAGPTAPPQRLGQLLPGAFDNAELVQRRATAPSNGTGTPEGGS